jgi:deoxyribonuclease-4
MKNTNRSTAIPSLSLPRSLAPSLPLPLPLLGVHTGIGGGLQRSIKEAQDKGCRTWQIFSRNPRGWTARLLTAEEIKLFRDEREKSELSPCIIHSCYLINMAARLGEIRLKSIAAFRDEIERGLAIGADYLVLHPGSAKDTSEEEAIFNCASAIRESTRGLEDRMRKSGFCILIENTAGQGYQIGRSFEQVRDIIDLLKDLPMGMCLDTAHSFAAGYDWRDEHTASRAFSLLSRTVGLKNVKVIHFNDSKVALNSRVDRHWHIGKGEIGSAGLANVINHPSLRHLPYILETPVVNQDDDMINLSAARLLILNHNIAIETPPVNTSKM